MRISLSIDEFAALRNALATRHDDLRELIAEYANDDRMAEPREETEAELAVIDALDARLVAAKS